MASRKCDKVELIDWWLEGEYGPFGVDLYRCREINDHILVDYMNWESKAVNIFVAYYGSQRKGAPAHSPKSCLPDGGWEMQQFSQELLEDVSVGNAPLAVNRALIQLGDVKQLVYYWLLVPAAGSGCYQ